VYVFSKKIDVESSLLQVVMNFQQMVKNNPEKYPANMGKPWKEDEVKQLLLLVNKQIAMDIIAETHERTKGSIFSKLRVIAAEMHENDSKTIGEIQTLTGLSKTVIEDSIEQRKVKKHRKGTYPKTQATKTEEEPTNREIMTILQEIRHTLKVLMDKVQ